MGSVIDYFGAVKWKFWQPLFLERYSCDNVFYFERGRWVYVLKWNETDIREAAQVELARAAHGAVHV